MVNGFNAYVKLYTYWDNSQLKEFLQITKLPKSYKTGYFLFRGAKICGI